jgi:hypothetical protein
MARNFGYGVGELDGLDKVSAHSAEGAAPARGRAFPILIFGHGYDCENGRRWALDQVIERTPALRMHSPVSVRRWATAYFRPGLRTTPFE